MNDIVKPKGFALLTPEERKEMARRGGKAAHDSGNAHEWTADEARAAGRRGGQATKERHAARKSGS